MIGCSVFGTYRYILGLLPLNVRQHMCDAMGPLPQHSSGDGLEYFLFVRSNEALLEKNPVFHRMYHLGCISLEYI